MSNENDDLAPVLQPALQPEAPFDERAPDGGQTVDPTAPPAADATMPSWPLSPRRAYPQHRNEPRLQCSANARPGRRCRRAPIPGGFVCALHGGKAPQTIASARRRLLEGSDIAIDYVLNMLEPRDLCEACGRSDNDRDPVVLRACQILLDRAGIGPSGTLSVETNVPHLNFEGFTTAYILERVEAIALKARALARLEARVEDLQARAAAAPADITEGEFESRDVESEPTAANEAAIEPPVTEGDTQ